MTARRAPLRLGLWFAFLASACSGGAPEATSSEGSDDAPVEVRVVEAEVRQRPVALELDGTLLADEESSVTSVVSGRVVSVDVERGAVVEEGDPLVHLRDVDFRLAARSARAQVEQARARLGMDEDDRPPSPDDLPEVQAARSALELAESNARRAEELEQHGVISEQTLEETRNRVVVARQQLDSAINAGRASLGALESARTTLAQASTSASDSTIRAPFSGEIADRAVSVGEYVTPQTTLVTLVRTDPLRVELSVPQRHLTAVQPGQTVQVQVDAVPDRTFDATVRYVSASVDPTSRGLTVEALVPNPDRLLRPGLFARARLETGGTEEVAVVPEAAVQTAAGVSRIFVVREGRIEERVITIADRSEGQVIVAEGLEPGETVAVGNLGQLGDGVAVTVAADNGGAPEATAQGGR